MLRKNVSGQFVHIQGVSATTGGILTGATWTMRRCLDGTFAAGGATITEDSTNGWYKVALTQADTNGNDVGYNFTATGAIPQTINDTTTACDPTTATNFGITSIPTASPGAANGLTIAGSNASTTFGNLTVTTTAALGSVTATAVAVSGNVSMGNLSNAGLTTLTGNVSLGGTLGVTGTTTLAAVGTGAVTHTSLAVTGNMTTGNISNAGLTTLTGNVSLGGTLGVTGTTTLAAVGTGALTLASAAVTGNLTMGNLSNAGTTALTGAVSTGALTLASATVTGNTTFSGPWVATNASNNVTGVAVTVGNVTLAASQGNITMNVIGSVSSVTGNVGGNVLGSTGSVFGAVGSVTGNIGGSMAGSVVGSVGSISGVTFPANFGVLAIDGSGDVTYNNAAPPTANANADALLGRNVAGGSSSGRLVKEAFYVLRNKVDAVAGNVYGTDDTAVAWTFVATTAPGNPITVIDPA